MAPGNATAETRAAYAALARREAGETAFDRYLLIEDTDDDTVEIRTLLRERSPRFMEPTP